jgi:hypothetical protein
MSAQLSRILIALCGILDTVGQERIANALVASSLSQYLFHFGYSLQVSDPFSQCC